MAFWKRSFHVDVDDLCVDVRACAWQKPTHIVERRLAVAVRKLGEIRIAGEEWKRKRCIYSSCLTDMMVIITFFFFLSFLLPLYCPLLVYSVFVCISCVLLSFCLFKWTQTCELVSSFALLFIVFIIAIVIIVAIVIVLFFFVGIVSEFSVCKWIYSARARTSMRTNVMREHLAQHKVCTTRKVRPGLFEWKKWTGYTAWMEK